MKYDSICRHNFKKGTGGEKEKKGTKSDELGIIGLPFQHILSFCNHFFSNLVVQDNQFAVVFTCMKKIPIQGYLQRYEMFIIFNNFLKK
jgi:hypothetical protein